MRALVVMFVIALSIIGWMYYNTQKNLPPPDMTQSIALRKAREDANSASNRAAAAEVQIADLKHQMGDRVTKLEQTVTNLTTEKQKSDQRVGELQTKIDALTKGLTQQDTRLADTDTQRTKLTEQLTSVSNQLGLVTKQYNDLQASHTSTVNELEGWKAKVLALEEERASLIRQLNDLDTLQAQIKLVKQRIQDERVAAWKKRDQEAAMGGNSGFLLKNGQWQLSTMKPAS